MPKHIEKDYYHRPDSGKTLNTCKACCISGVKERTEAKKAGVVNSTGSAPSNENEFKRRCGRCDDEKPESEFPARPDRPGKRYTICKACKREQEKERRSKEQKKVQYFEYALYAPDIMDYYRG
jgi:hypothetical protein